MTTDTTEKGLETLIMRHMTGTDGLAVAPNRVAERPPAYGGTGYTAASLSGEIELLREYRTRLVADVVTGKLDVREAVARLPEEEGGLSDGSDGSDLSDETETADEEAVV